MAAVAPNAEFRFIAHLPQWGLRWTRQDGEWSGGLPTVAPSAGSTVWGAVFAVPDDQFDQLDKVERMEGRSVAKVEAMDRTGKRHEVTIHTHPEGNGAGELGPATDYVAIMIDGSRHWSLPAGWIAGLEEHLAEGS